jgi:hypothetical protein
MLVDAAVVGLVFSAVSTLVVVIGAVAAVRQLRHLSRGNELAAMSKFVDEWSSADFAADRAFVNVEVPQLLANDPRFASAVDDPRAVRIARVMNFFERLSLLVRTGALSEELAMQLFGLAASRHWSVLRPLVAAARVARDAPNIGEYFEDFAMRFPAWQRRDAARRKPLLRDPSLPALAKTGEGLAASEP